ncbi:SprT-like family-domain-containing protein [Absidia repens]|uniref:SprT-like family-domain-containing protein n=1 Tax=Absidia repens TaxID=90262 RepID=A0A1X2IIS8_9FUNG|nr:SprT-like family-domain-containing protein [Absidia repens]
MTIGKADLLILGPDLFLFFHHASIEKDRSFFSHPTIMTASASDRVINDNDEDFARKLQQEEDRLYQQHIRMKALEKLDQEFAKGLQQELTSQSLETDLALARQLEMESYLDNTSSSPLKTTTSTTKTAIPVVDLDDGDTPFGAKRKYPADAIDLDDDCDPDLALARRLQKEENDKQNQVAGPSSSVSTACDVTDEFDPNPDLHGLFLAFNDLYFSSKLCMVEVKWSKRMTSCAGTCRYQSAAGLCTVTLSEALLKFRPRSDMIDTLLHEMIHALLFVTKRFDNHESHGPEFLREADRINKLAGTNITVYHTFHDEVKHYKTHVWKCNGLCQHRAPYFGIVSRSMNRPPQKADRWFADHQSSCGGTFEKISSPTPPQGKDKKQKKQKKEEELNKKMTDYLLTDSP